MNVILNATQHTTSAEQAEDGVIEPALALKAELQKLLTFIDQPTSQQVVDRAFAIADLVKAQGVDAAMIGGAPYLMPPLELALRQRGITPLYAWSERRSVEKTDPTSGEVLKSIVFKHLGFVEGALHGMMVPPLMHLYYQALAGSRYRADDDPEAIVAYVAVDVIGDVLGDAVTSGQM